MTIPTLILKKGVPMPVSDELKAQIHTQYGDQSDKVVQILEYYGKEDMHQEVERVHAAILELASGDINRVKELVLEARRDYRNILYWLTFDSDGNPPPLPDFTRDQSPKIPPDIPDRLQSHDILLKILLPATSEPQIVATNPSREEIRKHVYALKWNDITFVTAEIDQDNWLDGSGSLNPEDGLSGMCSIEGVQYVTEQAPESLDEIVELLHSFVLRNGAWRTDMVWT
ncbi:hypothetical protein Enr10x_36860 [Gimesia panareensis]|uniref:Uncharacterized protein n=1 Tax=Gimesia panareensis TaxID=2527978 RepID=A0A517Q9P1_9PLAN|nr:hypothetical protein [Gimesia panareensis]QDT28344.1 hypothetical protein Enr10x_36860 [Gimesia panareensis]